jgi:hypothetical protein
VAAPAEPAPAEAEPEEEVASAPAKPAAKAAGGKKSAPGSLPTTTADKIAWCRQHDGAK